MSCLYLNKSHYQFVADALYSCCVRTQGTSSFYMTRREFGQIVGSVDSELLEREIVSFVRALQDFNARAYAERYNESFSTPEYVKTAGAPTYQPLDAIVAKLLKSLECVSYQCSDAAAWKASERKAGIDRIIDDCRKHLIDQMQAYQEAPWAIE